MRAPRQDLRTRDPGEPGPSFTCCLGSGRVPFWPKPADQFTTWPATSQTRGCNHGARDAGHPPPMERRRPAPSASGAVRSRKSAVGMAPRRASRRPSRSTVVLPEMPALSTERPGNASLQGPAAVIESPQGDQGGCRRHGLLGPRSGGAPNDQRKNPATGGNRRRGGAGRGDATAGRPLQPSCLMSCRAEKSTGTEGPMVEVRYRLRQ